MRQSAIQTLTCAALLAVVSAGPSAAQDAGAGSAVRPGQRVILVTGSTDGLGREVALRLAADGAHVIVHGRNRERGAAVVSEITAQGKGSARFYAADFASIDAVRGFADAILRDYQRIDVLVNNAGIWLNRGERQLSADGHEMHFAVNYLSGFLLTHLLLPRITASAPSRIINVASGSQQAIVFDDVMLEQRYSGGRAYAQSKLAQVMFTMDLARQLDGAAVIVAALHPASLMDTPMVREAGVAPRSTVQEGADAVLHLVNSPSIVSGTYYDRKSAARPHAQAADEAARAQLRELSRRLVNLR